MAQTSTTDDAITALARRILEEVAPEELPSFGPSARAYLADRDRFLKSQVAESQRLGFGVEMVVVLLTPAALEIARHVAEWLVAEFVAAGVEEAGEAVRGQFRRILNGGGKDSDQQRDALSKAQLVEIQRVATNAAVGLGIPPAQARILADATVGALALGPA
jgi:hypothetical protein